MDVKSSSIVIPLGTTPNKTILLSEFDQIKIFKHVLNLYIYKFKSSNSNNNENGAQKPNFEDMRNALSQVLVPYYTLAGRLKWIEGNRLELDCNAEGVLLLEADSEATLDDFGDFGPSQPLKQFVPKVDYSCAIEEIPLLLAQVTRFRCGGLSVGLAISHSLVDGLSSFDFGNSWAKLIRGEKLDVVPFHEKNVFKSSSKKLVTSCFDHIEFKPLPISTACLDSKASQPNTNVGKLVMLKVTKEHVQKLKMMANVAQNMKAGRQQRPFSRFEVLVGHIWRCNCKVLYKGDSGQRTRVTIVVDCRNRLKPALPVGYFGNATLPTVTPMCVFGNLIYEPLCYAAGKIREAIDRMSDEYIRSVIGFIGSHKDVNVLRTSHKVQKFINEGNPDLYVVNWMNLPIHDGVDFGLGKPSFLAPCSTNYEGKVMILPCFDDDESFIIYLPLSPTRVESFKKFFYEDLLVAELPFVHSRV